MMRKIRNVTSILFLLLLLTSVIPVFAAEQSAVPKEKEIVVGYIPYDHMIKKDGEGNCYGYGVTYLKELAQNTGWTYKYVELEEKNRISALVNGEVDLICNLHQDCIGNEQLVFSKNTSGLEYAMLCALKDNNEIFYNDYARINGKKIGINRNSDLENSLIAYAQKNHITYEPVYFEDFETMQLSLRHGIIDIMLASSLRDVDYIKYVGKASCINQYFVTAKGNEALIETLNQADYALKEERPFYIADLYKMYYGQPNQKLTGITREEHEFIEKMGSVRVVCDANSYPIEYRNKDTGEYSGVYAEALKLISAESGLKFEYILLDDYSKAWDIVSNGEADMMASSYGNRKQSEYYHMLYSQSYILAEYTLIGNKDKELSEHPTIAIPKNYIGIQQYFKENEPEWEIVLYDNAEECLKAVNEQKTEITAIDSIFLQTAYNLDNYSKLRMIPNMTQSIPMSIGIGGDNQRVLRSILNKAIYQVPQSKFQKCITENAINISYKPNLLEILQRYSLAIILLLLLTAFAITLIIGKREKHYRVLAMTDAVTGLWNGVKFYQEAEGILEKNKEKTFWLISLDINKFKFINNDFGTKVGDEILWVLGQRIQKAFSGKGCYARGTADVFLILIGEDTLKGTGIAGASIEDTRIDGTSIEDTRIDGTSIEDTRIEKMLGTLNKEIYFNNKGKQQYYKITIKAGIRVIKPEEHGEDITLYADQASLARKTIKDSANEDVAYYDEKMKEIIAREIVIENKMEAALKAREFQVYLQPKYDLQTEKIIGAEALVRWVKPDGKIISPDEFVPLFEKNGFILKIDFYVYEEVMKRMAQWIAQGKNCICVSVNVSRVHIGTSDFFTKLRKLIETYQIPRELFELELTETIMGGTKGTTSTFVKECKEEGYQV
ncbi:MAG: transporter substrate-binding domain-containing protein, partial [Lachnospiraceae bacterium]